MKTWAEAVEQIVVAKRDIDFLSMEIEMLKSFGEDSNKEQKELAKLVRKVKRLSLYKFKIAQEFRQAAGI